MEIYLHTLFNLGAEWGGLLKPHPGRFTSGKVDRYPLHRRLGGHQVRSGPVRTGAENLSSTGIRSSDRPGRS